MTYDDSLKKCKNNLSLFPLCRKQKQRSGDRWVTFT